MKNHEGNGIHTYPTMVRREPGTGPGSAGQSGDTQGLPDVAEADSESVMELVEEGQNLEAELVLGMENEAPLLDEEDGDIAILDGELDDIAGKRRDGDAGLPQLPRRAKAAGKGNGD
jgi:hypothetical protein